jgi:hypothetical protein
MAETVHTARADEHGRGLLEAAFLAAFALLVPT